jgi:transposase InsO family protein
VIAVLVGQGYRPKQCCRIPAVAPARYFVWKRAPVSQAELRRQWLRQVITQGHSASRGTYGYKRVRAELRLGLGIAISRKTVHKLMAEEGLAGVLVRRYRKSLVNVATFEDLVQRNFTRDAPNQLWVTDITEHPTREGKVYCCVVLDVHSRRVVGWSIDTHQASSLVTNALSMALTNRTPTTGTVIHSDPLNPLT